MMANTLALHTSNPTTRDFILGVVQGMKLDMDFISKYGLINVIDHIVLNEPQLPCELEHHHLPGCIARSTILRKGSLVTTAMHRFWHPYIIKYGSVSVLDEVTDLANPEMPRHYTVKHIKAEAGNPAGHFTSITEPGTRRFIIVHEDTKWTTFHNTDETDPLKLKEDITIPVFNELLGGVSGHIPELSRADNLKPAKESTNYLPPEPLFL